MTRAVGARLACAARGGFAYLLHDAMAAAARTARKSRRGANAADEDEAWASRVRSVVGLVKLGELARAAQTLTSDGIAQGSDAVERILREMLHCDAPVPTPPASYISDGIRAASHIDFETFVTTLRSGPCGDATGVLGISYELVQ